MQEATAIRENAQPHAGPQKEFSNAAFRHKHIIPLLLALLFFAAMGVIAYFGYHRIYTDILQFGPAILWTSGKYFIIGFLLCFLLFLILLVLSIPPRKMRVNVDDQNIAITKGKHVVSFKWEEIKNIWLKITQNKLLLLPSSLKQRIILENQSGEIISLDGRIEPFDELIQIVRKNTYNYQSKQLLEEFTASKTINFGKASLNNETGVTINNKKLNFAHVDKVLLKKGFLLIKTRNKNSMIKIPIQNIANLDALLAILNYQGIQIQSDK